MKQQALHFIGTTLKELAIEKLVDLSKWLLEQMEEQILSLYKKASKTEREAFRKKFTEVYPDSHLLEKMSDIDLT